MRILDYTSVSHYPKLNEDPIFILVQDYNEYRIKINELNNALHQKSSIDFSGDKPTIAFDKLKFDDLKRFRSRRDEILAKIKRIEDYCSKEDLIFTSESEFQYNKGQLSVNQLKFNDEVNRFVSRLKNKRPYNIPAVIKNAKDHLGEGLTDNEYIKFGIISESNNLQKWYGEIADLEKNLKKFEEKRKEFSELVKKVCGV